MLISLCETSFDVATPLQQQPYLQSIWEPCNCLYMKIYGKHWTVYLDIFYFIFMAIETSERTARKFHVVAPYLARNKLPTESFVLPNGMCVCVRFDRSHTHTHTRTREYTIQPHCAITHNIIISTYAVSSYLDQFSRPFSSKGIMEKVFREPSPVRLTSHRFFISLPLATASCDFFSSFISFSSSSLARSKRISFTLPLFRIRSMVFTVHYMWREWRVAVMVKCINNHQFTLWYGK